MNLATDALYHGRAVEALRYYDAAAAVDGARGSTRSANARNDAAALELERQRPAIAVDLARRALSDARGVGGEPFFSHSLIARAQAQLSRRAESAKAIDEMKRMVDQLGDQAFGERVMRSQAGAMALERSDHAAAVQELKKAEATLSPNPGGGAIGIWFLLGSAYLAAGNDTEAASRFERVVNAGLDRVGAPLEFVRSLYFLGQIAERRGDREKARAYFRRFLGYWGEGDLDRERVADARKRLD